MKPKTMLKSSWFIRDLDILQVVVELRGAWEQADELLLGLWPQDLGPDSRQLRVQV